MKCIIDGAEFKTIVPSSSLVLHKLMYCECKRDITVKVLVSITAGRGLTLISSVFQSSISNKDIAVKNGLLNCQI